MLEEDKGKKIRHAATVSKMDKQKVLIGDIGGTNVRLQLIELDAETGASSVLKPLVKYETQATKSCLECILKYLEGVQESNMPIVCVIGIAGAVKNNKVTGVNFKGWGESDGNVI